MKCVSKAGLYLFTTYMYICKEFYIIIALACVADFVVHISCDTTDIFLLLFASEIGIDFLI